MSIFLTGIVIFFGVHCISIINNSWRNRMVSTVGEWSWKGLYALASILGFVLMVWGYAVSRYDSPLLYAPPIWLQHFSSLLLLPVFPLLIATYFPGRITTAVKHPMLLSTMLWAIAHLFSNGSLVDVILFGSFLCWAIFDRVSVEHRPAQSVPGFAYSNLNDVVACIAGTGLYLVFIFWLHELLIGVSLY